MTGKPMVYVAGPITGDPFGCVRQANEAFDWLRKVGAVPFLPQLSVIHEMVAHHDYEDWLAYDLDVIDRCDALLRLPGESKGADREIEYAHTHDKPVFYFDQPTFRRGLATWIQRQHVDAAVEAWERSKS